MTTQHPTDIDRLLEAWIRYNGSIRLNPETEPDFWAWEAMDKLCSTSPETAWALILRILNNTDHELTLENLAAGPLETLLVGHGEKIIGLVEERAEADPRFRWLLAGVWQNSIPDHLWSRIEGATIEVPEALPALPRFFNP